MSNTIYYIYSYTDPKTHEIIYIGKGKNNRYLDHYKHIIKNPEPKSGEIFYNTLRKRYYNENLKPIIKIIHENLSEDEAFHLEQSIIQKIGRKILNEGTLLNIHPGGRGGDTSLSENFQKKRFMMGNSVKNKKWYNNGKTEMRYAQDEQPEDWLLGRLKHKRSDNTKYITKHCENCQDNFLVADTNSERNKRYCKNCACKVHPNKGKKWYNNGTEQTLFYKGQQPKNWSIGKLK